MTHNQIVSIIDNSYDHENDINNVKIISIAWVQTKGSK
jgi:hypothetical protein